jgi:hypothetical protein
MHTIIGAHALAPGVIPARSSSNVSVGIGSQGVQYQGMPEGRALGIPYRNGADAEQLQAADRSSLCQPESVRTHFASVVPQHLSRGA